MAPPKGMGIGPPGQPIGPGSLAPVPADWATNVYHLRISAHPDDPSMPICTWELAEAGGDPVTGVGWNWNFGNNWDGNP